MKRTLLIISCVLITACTPYGKEVTGDFPVMPKDLSDCKIYKMGNDHQVLTVVRCPNSTTSTTYQQGKTSATVVVIDGVEYVRKGE